jgi:hypothetical protein
MTTPNTLVADVRGSGTAKLAVSCVNPLDHAAEIKDLFVTHERPEFPAFFDRAYPAAVAAGAYSWVGRDESGRIQAHVVQFPRRFTFGARTVRGALLGNLMVARPYRTFWPGVSLMRRAVTDLRDAATADFLYADPNELARPVGEAAGLRRVAELRRCVLPLGDRRPAVGAGIRAYRALWRWWAGAAPLIATERAPSGEPGPEDLAPLGAAHALRPVRDPSLYRSRLGGYPTRSDRWYVFHRDESPHTLVGRALVRGPNALGEAVLCVWECEPLSLLGSLLTALGDRLHALGGARVESYVMPGSRVEREFRRAAFLPREEVVPLLARPLTTLGSEVVEMASEWRILPVDLDR